MTRSIHACIFCSADSLLAVSCLAVSAGASQIGDRPSQFGNSQLGDVKSVTGVSQFGDSHN